MCFFAKTSRPPDRHVTPDRHDRPTRRLDLGQLLDDDLAEIHLLQLGLALRQSEKTVGSGEANREKASS